MRNTSYMKVRSYELEASFVIFSLVLFEKKKRLCLEPHGISRYFFFGM